MIPAYEFISGWFFYEQFSVRSPRFCDWGPAVSLLRRFRKRGQDAKEPTDRDAPIQVDLLQLDTNPELPEPVHQPTVHEIESLLENVRDSYDVALGPAGIFLFQEVPGQANAFYVSGSMVHTLGWATQRFSAAGFFQSIVHPEDQPLLFSTRDSTQVIDLTVDPDRTSIPIGHRQSIRIRDQHDQWRHFELRELTQNVAHAPQSRSGALIEVRNPFALHRQTDQFHELFELDAAAKFLLSFSNPEDPTSLMINTMNSAAAKLFRVEPSATVDQPLDTVFRETSSQLFRSALFDVFHTSNIMSAERMLLPEIPNTYVDLRVTRLHDGTLAMTLTDVTQTVAIEEQLRYQASHDPLTGLPGSALFESRVTHALEQLKSQESLALILIDIRDLSRVNETEGVHVGDQLLRAIGARLIRDVPGLASVSRLHGSHFTAVTLPASTQVCIERAHAIKETLEQAFFVNDTTVRIDPAIGVALGPLHGETYRSLMKATRLALDDSLRSDGQFAVYQESNESYSLKDLTLITELRTAIANNELTLKYQPVMSLTQDRVVTVEATPAWNNPARDPQLPRALIRLAEQSGLIHSLSHWLITEVGRATVVIDQQDLPVQVSVTLSVETVLQESTLAVIQALSQSGNFAPRRLQIHLTEGEIPHDTERLKQSLQLLAKLGVTFYLSDFGTAYTSLQTFVDLPISGIVMTPELLVNSEVSGNFEMLQATIDHAHDHGLIVWMPDVQTVEQLESLAMLKSDLVQGPIISEPLSPTDLVERVRQIDAANTGWRRAYAVHAPQGRGNSH